MKKIVFTLIMVFTLMQTFAQGNDPVVIGGAQKGDANATVEILSKNGTKGFMPPRLTQVQINALQASLKAENNGLSVYNTDEKCLQSWKGDAWTECNPVQIAKFDVDCASSGIKGIYYKDVPVTNNEYLELSVLVKKAGAYTFVAETQNGVRFFLSSVISTASPTPQIIKIPAFGTPTTTGTFNYNIVDQSGVTVCSSFPVTVTENNAVFTIDCNNTQVVGKFEEGTEVTGSDMIILNLNVTKAGNYTFKTVAQNGLTFFASGTFAYPGFNQVNLRPVIGSIPTWKAPDGVVTFDILDKDGVSLGCSVKVPVTSTKAEVTVDCNTGVKVDGLLIAGQSSTGQNKITITTNVTKVGPWKAETNLINGLKFAGSGIFTETGSSEDNEMILYADGTPTTVGNQMYTITDKLSNATICSNVKVVVSPNEAVFTLGSCSAPSQSGTWKSNSTLVGATATVNMVASQAGPYSLSARGAGMTLTASGNASAGTNTIIFAASGTPETSGSISLDIKNSKDEVICTITINVIASKGTKDNPATSCADILSDIPTAKDGEYWIKPATGYAGQAIKTFCDMTNGGLTLVWSFTEQTALTTYQTVNQGAINGDYFRFNVDQPKNADNYTSETINYENFRLPRAVMRGLSPENQLYFKVRIASGVAAAKDVNDANALANYAIFPTVYNNLDIRYDACTERNWIGTGKILGTAFGTGANNVAYYGTKTSGVYMTPYHSGGYAFHINWDGGSTVSGAGNPNYFGWFGEGGQEVNGHFYNCKTGNAACSGNTTGSSGVMVSNPTTGGRLLQYFMK